MLLLVIDNDRVIYRPKTVREGNAYILGAGRGVLCNVLSGFAQIGDLASVENPKTQLVTHGSDSQNERRLALRKRRSTN